MDYVVELDRLKKMYEDLKRRYYNESGKRDQLSDQVDKIEKVLQRIIDNIDTLEKVRGLLQKASEYTREETKRQIEYLVTNCLKYVFDIDIQFSIEISESRGRYEADFYIVNHVSGETVRTKPYEAHGGGIIDIISLALRLAMLQSTGLNIDGPIILDEPVKHVSDEFINEVGEFLKRAGSMLDRQIIMVTHNSYLGSIADTRYRVELTEGRSQATFDS